jgi:type IV pilus assembly protein PilV
MKPAKRPVPAKSQQGIVLLEALIAILIFSIGILGVVGLQANMIKATTDAKYRSQAAFLVQQKVGAMWVDQGNLSGYVVEPDTDISATSGLPGGKLTVTRGDVDSCANNLSCFVVTVSWQQPGSSEVHKVTTVARIVGG